MLKVKVTKSCLEGLEEYRNQKQPADVDKAYLWLSRHRYIYAATYVRANKAAFLKGMQWGFELDKVAEAMDG